MMIIGLFFLGCGSNSTSSDTTSTAQEQEFSAPQTEDSAKQPPRIPVI